MLRVSNLSKKFGDFQVLKNININAEKNQIYGLVGSNGCGKTTILKHIMQVYKQDEGYIAFDEENQKNTFPVFINHCANKYCRICKYKHK
jgi:ABC-2 type transport system ATP-binding protein